MSQRRAVRHACISWRKYAEQKDVSDKTLDRWAKQGLIAPPLIINGRKFASETEGVR
jgi:predicted site-specific integrase-resolvase